MSLLDDFTSRDPQRIWSASCAVRTLRDPGELRFLVEHLDEIERRTRNIPLGGALRPNATHLEFALRKLEYIRVVNRCLCDLYPRDELYDPVKEAEAGNVTILRTTVNAAEWSTQYACECRVCRMKYDVEEREYHYTWWAWTRVEPTDTLDGRPID